MHQSHLAAIILGAIGLIFIGCHLAFAGRRTYLGLVGLAFWMVSGNVALSRVPWARLPRLFLAAVAVICLALAVVAAWQETKRRLQRMREASEARAQAFLETLQAEQAKNEKRQS